MKYLELLEKRMSTWYAKWQSTTDERYKQPNKAFYGRAVRFYMMYCIREGVGIIDKMASVPTAELIAHTADVTNELQAQAAAYTLASDTGALTLEQLRTIKSNLDTTIPKCVHTDESRWTKIYYQIESGIQNILDEWHCDECDQQFEDEFDFNCHIENIPGTSYYDPPEQRCIIPSPQAERNNPDIG